MTWTKLSDSFTDELDDANLSPEAAILHVAALCYSMRLLTDGRIRKKQAQRLYTLTDPGQAIQDLIDAGYWIERDDCYEIVNFLEDQRSAETIRREQVLKKERQARWLDKKRSGEVATSNGHKERDASQDASRDGAPAQPSPALKEDGLGWDATASGEPGGSPSPSHPSEKETTNFTLTTDRGPDWSYEPEDDGDHCWRSTMVEVPFGIQVWSATDDDGEDRPGWVDIYTTLIDPPDGCLPDSVTKPVYRILKSEFATNVDVGESDYSFTIQVEDSEADYWLGRVMDAVSSEQARSVVQKVLIPHGSPEWETRRSKARRDLNGASSADGEWEFSISTRAAMTQINGATPVLIEGQSVIIVAPSSVPELEGDANQQQGGIFRGIANAIWKVISALPGGATDPQWIEDRLAFRFQVPDGMVGIRAAQVRDTFQTVEVRDLLGQLVTLWESTDTDRAPGASR